VDGFSRCIAYQTTPKYVPFEGFDDKKCSGCQNAPKTTKTTTELKDF